MSGRILLVDDEIDFLEIMSEFITEEGYEIKTATDGEQALKLLKRTSYDLLVSDINMPGMKGFELLKQVSELYPAVKRILITAYDVRDYINMAKNYNIGNIMTKTTPFNFDEIGILLKNIITGAIFGLDRYIQGTIHSSTVNTTQNLEQINKEVISFMRTDNDKHKFRQALSEVAINAFFYGAKNERGDMKHQWQFDTTLSKEEEIIISWGRDNEKTGVCVTDQKGRLTKKDILHWLERNLTRDDAGFSMGLHDTHGKGIFIARETVDRFIANIQPGKKSEIVLINYEEGLYDGHRPLWIQEL